MIFIIAALLGCMLGSSTCSDFPDSPCSNIAQYTNLGGRPVIYVRAPNPRSANSISVFLFVAGAVSYDSKIEIRAIGDSSDSYIDYAIIFPLTIRIPTINQIIFNGDEICSGPRPQGQLFSTLCASLKPDYYDGDEDEDVKRICGIKHPEKTFGGLIANGKKFKPGDFPWMVALLKSANKKFICAGTLISKKVVLTAYHCLKETTVDDIIVKLGGHNLTKWNEKGTVLKRVAEFKLHNAFDEDTFKNDIALIIMTSEVQFKDNIVPACLWSGDDNQAYILDKTAELAGWGTNERGTLNTDSPRMLGIKMASKEECVKNPNLATLAWDYTICAGNRDGAGPCNGDSGGGLLVQGDNGRFYVRGLVSVSLRMNGICDYYNYAVFTDVAKYDNWINAQINPNRFEEC